MSQPNEQVQSVPSEAPNAAAERIKYAIGSLLDEAWHRLSATDMKKLASTVKEHPALNIPNPEL